MKNFKSQVFFRQIPIQFRGGSGVMRLVEKNSLCIGERNIIPGHHLPDYPKSNAKSMDDGKAIGDELAFLTPDYAWGLIRGQKPAPFANPVSTMAFYFLWATSQTGLAFSNGCNFWKANQ